jgi:excisionase family DNA binding protein
MERGCAVEDDRLLTVTEVAAMLRANPETVRRWLREGVLAGFRPGGKRLGYRIRASEVERFLTDQEGAPRRPAGTEGNAAA